MKMFYRDLYQCPCGELFMIVLPVYQILFNRELAREADRQYQFQILRHTIAHMEERLNGQAERIKVRSY
mgnify:CR=1 FL=1